MTTYSFIIPPLEHDLPRDNIYGKDFSVESSTLKDIVAASASDPDQKKANQFIAGDAFVYISSERPTCDNLKFNISEIFKTIILDGSTKPHDEITLSFIYLGDVLPANGAFVFEDSFIDRTCLTTAIKNVCYEWRYFKRIGVEDSLPKVSIQISCPLTAGWAKFLNDSQQRDDLSQILENYLGLKLQNVSVNPGSFSDLERSTLAKAIGDLMKKIPISVSEKKPYRIPKVPLRIAAPTMFLFPEGTNQGLIFALPQYTLMVNCGGLRKPNDLTKMCFNMPAIDSVLMTEFSLENARGLANFSEIISNDEPNRKHVPKAICLPFMGPKCASSSDPENSVPTLIQESMIRLKNTGTNLTTILKRGCGINESPDPLTLYQKLGEGVLELYTLTPSEEEFRDERLYLEKWNENAPNFIVAAGPRKKPNESPQKLISKFSCSFLLTWRRDLSVVPSKLKLEDDNFSILIVPKQLAQEPILEALEKFSYKNHAGPVRRNQTAQIPRMSPQKDKVTRIVVNFCVVPEFSCQKRESLLIWFSKVHARVYVVTDWCPLPTILESLLEVKTGSWEAELKEISVIFAHDSQAILRYLSKESDKLENAGIKVSGFANRSQIRVSNEQEEELIGCIKVAIN